MPLSLHAVEAVCRGGTPSSTSRNLTCEFRGSPQSLSCSHTFEQPKRLDNSLQMNLITGEIPLRSALYRSRSIKKITVLAHRNSLRPRINEIRLFADIYGETVKLKLTRSVCSLRVIFLELFNFIRPTKYLNFYFIRYKFDKIA